MTAIDDIHDSDPARSLALVRTTANSLRNLGWRVSEGTFFDSGTVDIAAERVWSRDALHARVRLVVNCISDVQQVLFSQLPEVGIDEILPSHTLSENAIARTATVPAPRSRAHAATFREIGGNSFRACVEATFDSIDAIRATLRNHDLAVIADDLEDGAEASELEAVHTVDLLHPIIATDATLRTLSVSLTPKKSVRLIQSAIAGGEHRWIDVVQSDAIEEFAATAMKHYETRYKKFGGRGDGALRTARRRAADRP
jgi:hypothetical protein